MEFKIGDRVERLESSYKVRCITTGWIYTVSRLEGRSIALAEIEGLYSSKYFKLLTEATSCDTVGDVKINKEKHMSITIVRTITVTGKGKDIITVNGMDVLELTDDDILHIITTQEQRIATLAATKAKPKRLKDSIVTLKAELKTFIELID